VPSRALDVPYVSQTRLPDKWPATPWPGRLRLLIEACGWTRPEAARMFGLKDQASIRRVLKGGRPSVRFVLRLAELEAVNEGKIRDWEEGLRTGGKSGSGPIRVGSRGITASTPRWPFNDVGAASALGVLGATAGGQRFDGDAGGEGKPRKVVYVTRSPRYRRGEDRSAWTGRPAADGGGPGSAAAGIRAPGGDQ